MSTQTRTPTGMDQTNTMNGADTPKSSDNSDSETLQLARRLSAESKNLGYASPLDAPAGGALDPNSEKFDAKVWAKLFYNALYASDPARVMGVAYENLNVFGYGSDTDFQGKLRSVRWRSLEFRWPSCVGQELNCLVAPTTTNNILRGLKPCLLA